MKTSVAIGALIAVALSFHPEALPGPFDQTLGIETQGNKDVPEKVLYEMYFRRVALEI